MIDTGFDPMKHVSVSGTVVEVCELRFDGDFIERLKVAPHDNLSQYTILSSLANEVSLPWETEMELCVGDRVLFNYVNHLVAQDEDLYFDDCILVPYSQVYTRLDPVRPVNGHFLVEPLPREEAEIFIKRKTDVTGVGIVRHASEPISRFLDHPPAAGAKVGQIVLYDKSWPTIEYKYHQRLNQGGRPLVRMQHILAVLG